MQPQSLLGRFHATAMGTCCQLLLVGREQPVASAANAKIVCLHMYATCCQLSRSCNLLLTPNYLHLHAYIHILHLLSIAICMLFFTVAFCFWFCVSFCCTRVVCQLFTPLTSSPSACASLLQLPLLSLHTFYHTYMHIFIFLTS